jgi:CSLREA domain-containing protein
MRLLVGVLSAFEHPVVRSAIFIAHSRLSRSRPLKGERKHGLREGAVKDFGFRFKGWLSSSGVRSVGSVCIRGASRAVARPKFLIALVAPLAVVFVFLIQSNLKAITNTITVNTTSDTPAAHFCTLREAIANANAEADVSGGHCSAGTGNDTINFSVSGTTMPGSLLPAIANNLTIDGTGQSITIDAGNSFQVLLVNSGASVALTSLTITHGFASGTGGGGGITSLGTLTITNSTFSNNKAGGSGGGLYAANSLTIVNSTFSGNSAGDDGGGVFAGGSTTNISNSTFINNTQTISVPASKNGGAIYATVGTTTVTDSTFSLNSTASNGGGIFVGLNATVNVINSTFYGNSATYSGGAVANTNGATLSISNSTLSGNTDGTGLGTVSQSGSGTVTINNSILAGSGAGGNCAGTITFGANSGYNISDDSTCNFGTGNLGASGQTIGDNVNPDLSSAGLANNGGPTDTIALQSISPAIDAIPTGNPNCPGADQRGAPRPAFGETACDIGAYEFSTASNVDTLNDDNTPGDGLCSLRKAINNANNPGTDTTDGDCAINNGSTPITFSVHGTITLSPALGTLPTITGTVVINGPKSSSGVTVDGGSKVEIFDVAVGGSLTLSYLTLAHGDNTEGGAVQNYGSLTINNCTLDGNLGEVVGGAIYNQGGTVQITNSTLSDNETGADGGSAIFDDFEGSLTIINSTIADNFGSRPAIFENDLNSLTITNSILADNTGGNCAEFEITSAAFSDNISDDGSCGFGTSTGANGKTIGDNVNPLLDSRSLRSNGGPTETIELQVNSPAIDAVPNGSANCPGIDQRGDTRPDVGPSACDIGALESSGVFPPTPTPTKTATPTTTPKPTMTVRRTPTATPTPRKK